MGKKIYWMMVGLVAAVGVGFMVQFALQPRPIPKIKLSGFSDPTEIADALQLRLNEEIKSADVVFLGYQHEVPHQVFFIRHLLQRLEGMGIQYPTLLAEEKLEGISEISRAFQMPTLEQKEQLIEQIKVALTKSNKVAVIVPMVYSVQAIPGNLVNIIKAELQRPVLSLSLVDLPRDRADEKKMPLPCVVEGVDRQGTGPFGCQIVQRARAHYRKRLEGAQWAGLVDQVGLTDFVIYFGKELK